MDIKMKHDEVSLPAEDVVGADGSWTIGLLRLSLDPGVPWLVGIAWSPEFFAQPLDGILRQEIVRVLRFHAEKLESGETDRRIAEIAAAKKKEGSDA